MSRLPGENLKKKYSYIFELCPLQIRALETCITEEKCSNQDISKTITARSFNLGQLLEDDE